MTDTDPDCLFCKILAGELPATIVAEDERTIAFMDISPASRGHALVIPRAHATDLHEIDPDDEGSRLTLYVATVHGDAPDPEVMGTLDAIRRLVEADV